MFVWDVRVLKAKGILFTTAFLTVVSGSVKTDTRLYINMTWLVTSFQIITSQSWCPFTSFRLVPLTTLCLESSCCMLQHVAWIQHVASPRNQWLEIAYLASLGSCYDKWMYVLQPYHTFAQQDPVAPVSDKAWLFLGFVQQRLSQKRLKNLTK